MVEILGKMTDYKFHPMRKNREILQNLYINLGLSLCEIGKMFNRDPKTIKEWLQNLSIPTRNQSEATILRHRKYAHPFQGKNLSNKHKENIGKAGVGRKHSWQMKEKLKKERIGDKWTNWKGGIDRVTSYRVWEKYWHEKTPEGYILHHVDRDKTNNGICNLALVTRPSHYTIHFGGN